MNEELIVFRIKIQKKRIKILLYMPMFDFSSTIKNINVTKKKHNINSVICKSGEKKNNIKQYSSEKRNNYHS